MDASDVEYRTMTKADEVKVRQLMDEVFFIEETIASSLDFKPPEETRAYHDAVLPGAVDSEASVVVVHGKTIVGVMLNVLSTKENQAEIKLDKRDLQTVKLRTMDGVYDPVYEGIDFFELYNVEISVVNRGLCVSPAHRRRGVASRLLKESLERMKRKAGSGCFVIEATTPYTEIMLDRLGFDTVRKKPYSELLVDGKQIVQENEDHKYLSLHAKII